MVWAIVVVLCGYAGALAAGWPQRATALIAAEGAGQGGGHEAPVTAAAEACPPSWTIGPFAILLVVIAVFPLVPRVAEWWDNNLHRLYLALGLGLLTLLYYVLWFEHPVTAHFPASHVVSHNPDGANFAAMWAVLANALFAEYVPFILLLFTLYTITGGIHIEGDLRAHPATNAAFIGLGAILASLIGTTGAAMLLIRPLLETNRERRHVAHTVVFFIFAVCNCGGCLLPLGDPPLFLGYLLGVPFLWTLQLWPEWLFVNVSLVAIYYVWDKFGCYPREAPADVRRDETQVRRLSFQGLGLNAPLLVGVILSIALLDPAKPFPGTTWHPWLYLREAVQLVFVALSLRAGQPAVRRANQFNYHAIVEVAVLFLGIFICMQAPLQILHARGSELGLTAPAHFFWATGSLSSVLDNAPTYVVFFAAAQARSAGGEQLVAGVREGLLAGVSLGAVFMGSMTYIGNGPNFMVKTIAEKSGVRMPSFFGYMVYSCAVLLPLFALTTWLFLH
jgi:Na+/H+ antiporter NhaD/arsenite permease-like protein